MTDKRIQEPCPFCGTPAKEIQIREIQKGMSKIYCPKCRATFEGYGNKIEMISKWNLRFR